MMTPRLQLILGPFRRGRDRPASRRERVPIVLQMEAVECGAACLAMVLASYGRFMPLEELRLACGVSRDGTKASNIVKAARTFGLKAKGFTKEPDELPSMPLPQIVFWNFNHFVVVTGFRNGRVYLNDPATGRQVVSREEFDQSFTGVVLVFEPGPEFRRGGVRQKPLQGLRARLGGSQLALIYVILASLALVIPGLIVPAFTRIFIDSIIVGGLTGWVRPLLIGMALTAAVNGALIWLQQSYLLRLETKLAISTSSTFFWHVLRLPISFFTQRYGGEIGSRVQINDTVAELLSGRLATTALNLVMIVFYAFLLIQYDLMLTVIGIGIALLNLAALRYVSRKRIEGNDKVQQEAGKFLGTSMHGLQMIETLKATGSEADFFVRWSGYQAKVENAKQGLGVYTQSLAVVPSFLMALNTAIILAVGALRIMNGDLTVGMLVAFQGLMFSFLAPVNGLLALGGQLQDITGDMGRLDDVLRNPIDRSNPAEAAPPDTIRSKLSGRVELRDISFGYTPLDPPLIEHFSLLLNSGERVALVGGSGSGKSTIARIVAGLYEPWTGEIRFDGLPRQDVDPDILHQSLAMVDQDIVLLEGSVRDNLTLWDATLPDSVVVNAAQDAQIHGEITARSGGYDCQVGEGGGNWSGGQRQRLEIARALAVTPTILVLDEATSALDPITEQKIGECLRARGCTCLIVAHRLSTIRDCDEIIVLDRGKVVQRGTHETLRAVEGLYARLIADEAP